MKTNLIATVLLVGILFISCSENNDQAPITPAEIEDMVQSDTWRITKFIDSDEDETQHFAGYTFTFGGDGTLTASNGTNTYTGTWSITDSNSNDDSPDDLDFNIYFNLTNDFEDLNDDWDFISQSPVKIELIDISGGNGGTDYLTFEQN